MFVSTDTGRLVVHPDWLGDVVCTVYTLAHTIQMQTPNAKRMQVVASSELKRFGSKGSISGVAPHVTPHLPVPPPPES
jgi:hypothetical protein